MIVCEFPVAQLPWALVATAHRSPFSGPKWPLKPFTNAHVCQ